MFSAMSVYSLTPRLLLEMRHFSTLRVRITALSAALVSVLVVCALKLPPYPWMILLPLLTISSATDTAWMFIPNWLTGFALLLAFVAAAAGIDGSSGLMHAIEGFTVVSCISLLLYASIGLGAGDVKLSACLGVLLGVETGLSMLLWSYIAAGLAAAYILADSRVRHVLQQRKSGDSWYKSTATGFFRQLDGEAGQRQPMAAFFAVGTLVSLNGGRLI